MNGELTRKGEADRGLDISGGEGRLLDVAGQAASLSGKSSEYVVDKGVQDRHILLRDTDFRVDLLQGLVDGRRVGSTLFL